MDMKTDIYLCSSCTKELVCKYAEDCKILTRKINSMKMENIFNINVKCKHYQEEAYITRASINDSLLFADNNNNSSREFHE